VRGCAFTMTVRSPDADASSPQVARSKISSASMLEQAECFLAGARYGEAEVLARALVHKDRDAEHDRNATCFTGAACIWMHAMQATGRLAELTEEVPRMYGCVSKLPVEALLLWASFLADDGHAARARELMDQHVYSRSSSSNIHAAGRTAFSAHVACAAARLYAVDVVAVGLQDQSGALKWLQDARSPCSLTPEQRQMIEDELHSLHAGNKVEAPPVCADAKPTSSDPLRQSEVLEHNTAPLATSSTTSTNRRSQQQRPSSSWAVWASDALSSTMGSSAVDLGQASLYAAVGLSGCTLIYCVVAERRAIRRFVGRCSSQAVVAAQLALGLGLAHATPTTHSRNLGEANRVD